jgi:hypothetical protein
MNKIRNAGIIIVIITIFLLIGSYWIKNSGLFFISWLPFSIYLTTGIIYLGFWRYFTDNSDRNIGFWEKASRFLFGNFEFTEEKIDSISIDLIQVVYPIIVMPAFAFVSYFINFYKFDLNSLIIIGLSLFLLGATFAILMFEYLRSSEIRNEKIFASGKRFMLATIIAIPAFLSILTIDFYKLHLQADFSFQYYTYNCLQWLISIFTLIFYGFLLPLTFRYLLEGFILLFGCFIDFEKPKWLR